MPDQNYSMNNPADNSFPNQAFPTRLQLFCLALLYMGFVVYGSLVPLNFKYLPFAESVLRFQNIPYLSLGIGYRADWVSNILLFIPFSYCWMAVILDGQTSVLRMLVFGSLIVLVSAGFSVAIDFTQVWFPPRTVSLNDIAAEIIGSIAGVFLWVVMGTRLNLWLRSFDFKRTPMGRFDWILQAYCIGFLIYSFLPFDLTISMAEIWHKVKQGKVILIPFSDFAIDPMIMYGYFRDLITAIPIGMLVACWRTDGSLRTLPQSMIYGAVLISAVEFGQLFVYSRSSDVTDIILGIGGIWAGRKLMGLLRADSVKHHQSPKVKNWLLWLVVFVYAGFLVSVFCYPFDVTTNMAIIRERYLNFFKTPFTVLYYGTEYNAVSEVLKKGLFFMPLGIISGLIYLKTGFSGLGRQALRFFFLGGCVFLAAVIEIAQIFIPSKIADFTDILLCTAGAWGGFFLATRIIKNVDTLRSDA